MEQPLNYSFLNGLEKCPVEKKKDKRKAELKWSRLREKDRLAILADVPKRLAEDRSWKAGYVPHPTTYLNGERWNDEIQQDSEKVYRINSKE
jgi:hypothetical protein